MIKIKELLDSQLGESYSGYSFALVTGQQAPLLLANGKRNYQDPANNIDSTTLFDLASLSKVIGTTTAILKLIETGHFHLQTKIKTLLPNYQFEDTTVFQLLTHTSGLPADLKSYKNCQNKVDFIDFIYQIKPTILAEPTVVYSDFGFILLGFIIEKLVGSLPNYLAELVFKPLKMLQTTYHPVHKNDCAATELTTTRGLIQGEVHDGKAYLLTGESGNAGLFSTANDLANFAQMLLNQGSLFNQQILTPATINLLKTTSTANLNENRSLGWMKRNLNASQGDYASNNLLYHTGFAGTSFLLDFDYHLAIILLTNRINPRRDNPGIFELRPLLHNLIYQSIIQ